MIKIIFNSLFSLFIYAFGVAKLTIAVEVTICLKFLILLYSIPRDGYPNSRISVAMFVQESVSNHLIRSVRFEPIVPPYGAFAYPGRLNRHCERRCIKW